MSDIYYVVLLDGVPMDVTRIWSKAQMSQKELSVPGKPAIILPCMPLTETGDMTEDFTAEEPTENDL